MRDAMFLERARIEEQDDWRGAMERIPFIQFPADWQDGRKKSIYLDCFDRLGYVGQPYWEVYPVRGDTERCLLNEIPELLAAIAAPSEEPSPDQLRDDHVG